MNWDTKLYEVMRAIDPIVFAGFGDKVLAGPFAGMQIPKRIIWDDGNLSCKLFGTYEHVLHEHIERAIGRNPAVVVNIGCAEGYYAIGMARRLPQAKVYAIDIDERSLALCHLYAEKNGVGDQVKVVVCSEETIAIETKDDGHHLFIMDCEGAELKLVDFEYVPKLRTSDLIIECHDFGLDDCSAVLFGRLKETHYIVSIEEQMPNPCEALAHQSVIMHLLIVTDKRPAKTKWLVAWAKERADDD